MRSGLVALVHMNDTENVILLLLLCRAHFSYVMSVQVEDACQRMISYSKRQSMPTCIGVPWIELHVNRVPTSLPRIRSSAVAQCLYPE